MAQTLGDAMTIHRRKFIRLAGAAAALPVLPRVAKAQTYPARPVRIIVGYAAGGGVDITGRLIGHWLSIARRNGRLNIVGFSAMTPASME